MKFKPFARFISAMAHPTPAAAGLMKLKTLSGFIMVGMGIAAFFLASLVKQVAFYPLGFALICYGGAALLNVKVAKLKVQENYEKLSKNNRVLQSSLSNKIPLTIGFANLIGEDMNYFVQEDASVLSPLFLKTRIVAPHQIPSAEVLFLYANLNDDGTIHGTNASGIRQIVQLTNAALLIVASPNSVESIKNAMELPGPRTANLVFTLDRNKNGFGRFFRELFEKMQHGKPMMNAWVELAPQGPGGGAKYGPAVLYASEGGNIGFPKAL